jgi:hypothetical protein
MGNDMGDFDGHMILGEVWGIRNWTWRITSMRPDDATLIGVTGNIWWPGRNVARCNRAALSHQAPRPECTCGFWAYWDRRDLSWAADITGIVKGYGETLIGERGFRCQVAEIAAIAPARRMTWLEDVMQWIEGGQRNRLTMKKLHQIGDHYQIPVFKSVRTMLMEYPVTEDDYFE